MLLQYKTTWLRSVEKDHAKAFAAAHNVRLGDVIAQAVREYLERHEWTPPPNTALAPLEDLPDAAPRSYNYRHANWV